MRVGFKTTLEEDLIRNVKMRALQENINVNDIIEVLLEMYLNGQIDIYHQCQERNQKFRYNQGRW